MLSLSAFKRLFKRAESLRARPLKATKQRSRQLTAGEIALARSVFGDSIRLEQVQLKTAFWVLKNYAVSPNGIFIFTRPTVSQILANHHWVSKAGLFMN